MFGRVDVQQKLDRLSDVGPPLDRFQGVQLSGHPLAESEWDGVDWFDPLVGPVFPWSAGPFPFSTPIDP